MVEAPVDPRLEAAEIHRRVIAAGGPALLFTNPKGADFPLVTNLFGTARRAERAFGRNAAPFIKRAVELAQTALPPTAAKLWSARDVLKGAARIGMKRRRAGAVIEKWAETPRLDRLPVLTCWPEDGGPFVTLPLVLTAHPDGHGTNLGMYRLQVHSPSVTGMHWQIGKGGGFHYAVAEARGEALPATVFLGGPPALILAAIAPLPENVPELMLASLIAGEKLETIAGHGPHPLIANAEFALIGSVPPRVRRPEGPFGDHYGYYSLQHDYPVFNLSRIAHRKDAIYPATVVGKPRQEDFFIGDLLQELLSPLFPLVMPGVLSLWSYGETGYHSLAAAVVRERYRREAMASAFRILGEGQLSLTKFLLVTDRSVNLKDFPATLDPHPGAHAAADRPLLVLEPVDGHARLHRPTGERGFEGRVARPRRSGAPAAARVLSVCRRAARLPRRASVLSRLPRRGRPAARGGRGGRAAAGRVAGFGRLATRGPHRRTGASGEERDELPLDHLHALRTRPRRPRPQPDAGRHSRQFRVPHRHRRPSQARFPGRTLLQSGHGPHGQ